MISLLVALLLCGCAERSDRVLATSAPTSAYENESCDALTATYLETLKQRLTVGKKQDDKAYNDSVAAGLGLALFPPFLLLLATDDSAEEVARLKGELKAIETVSRANECAELSDRIARDQRQIRAREIARRQQFVRLD